MRRMSAARGCFVTGTDTGVGKTRVSAALLHLLGADGSRTAGCKPIAAGLTAIDGRRVNEDVLALTAASTLALTESEVGPCQLDAACAPHIAAELEHRVIDPNAVFRAVFQLAAQADWLVVEGVGGFRVPLGPHWDTADLARDLGLPVVIVVGLRLGCLNHTLLTADAIDGCGLTLAGWVANRIDPAMDHADANIAALRERLWAPCLGVVPWLAQPTPASIATCLDGVALRAALQPLPFPEVPA
jgi:dethiobiotin synthetase